MGWMRVLRNHGLVVLAASFVIGCLSLLIFAKSDRSRVEQLDAQSPEEFIRELPLKLPEILGTIYLAYDEAEEVQIYDLLSKVAADEALEALYLERISSLDRAGLSPSQKIHEVKVSSMAATVEDEKIEVRAEWQVLGTVGHAEHMHMRGNGYTAELSMEPREGEWRIVSFTLIDVDRSEVGEIEQHSDPSKASETVSSVEP